MVSGVSDLFLDSFGRVFITPKSKKFGRLRRPENFEILVEFSSAKTCFSEIFGRRSRPIFLLFYMYKGYFRMFLDGEAGRKFW